MTEKQQQLLFDKGITNVPSDVLCSDNTLAESVGMVYDDGEHRVIQKPSAYTPSAGIDNKTSAELIIIHRFNDVLRHILRVTAKEDGSTYNKWDLCYKILENNEWKTYKLGVNITGEVKAETIGNTLVISAQDGLHYFLWDYVNNRYKNLGTKIPDIQVRFSLSDIGYLGIDPGTGKPDPSRSDDLDPGTFVKLPKIDGVAFEEYTYDSSGFRENQAAGNKWKDDTGSDYEDAKAGLIGLVSARLNWVKERKHFAFPFWARSAVRLYDGSYVNISNPFLLLPSVFNNWHVFCCDYEKPYEPRIQYIDAGDEDDWVGWDQANYMPLCAKLMCQTIIPNGIDLSKWEDIISGVDIFVSEEVKNFDMEGSWKILNIDSEEQDSQQLDAITSDTCMPIYGWKKKVQKHVFEDSTTWHTYYKPSLLSESEITDRLIKKSVFYKIIELDRDELNNYTSTPLDTTTKIDRGVLMNLTTQLTLENDDYFSRSDMVPGITKSYNSRLHMADVWRGFFSGFNHFSYTAYNIGTKIEYHFYVHIKSEGGERIVASGGVSREIHEVWFFYPDPRAYQVDVYRYASSSSKYYKLSSFPLKEHPSLHGAYYFGSLPQAAWIPDGGVLVQGTPQTKTNMELLEGQVIVSEVNNPWLFNASGYVNVGMGRIIGLASQTVALGQEEHGIHPLIVFSERGISTLRLNNEGVYIRSDELSREVCSNPKSITETDGAVFFVSDKGLMVIAGNQVKCVSEQLSGLYDSWAAGKIDTGFGNYKGFFDNCFIAYDYRDSLLWIFDGSTHVVADENDNTTSVYGLPHCLVYAIKSGTFTKMKPLESIITKVVNDYPDYILESGTRLYSLINRKSVNADDEKYSAQILTRPMKLENALALKSIMEIRNMGYFSSDAGIKLEIYASNNLKDWVQITSLRGIPWLYYRFLYTFTDLYATDRFAGAVLVTQERRTNKLRFMPARYTHSTMDDPEKKRDLNPQPPAPGTPSTDQNAGQVPGENKPIDDPTQDPPTPTVYTYKAYVDPLNIIVPSGSSAITQMITVRNTKRAQGQEEKPCELYVKVWRRVGETYTQIAASVFAMKEYTTAASVTEDTEGVVVCVNTSAINTPNDYVDRVEISVNGSEPGPEPTPEDDEERLIAAAKNTLKKSQWAQSDEYNHKPSAGTSYIHFVIHNGGSQRIPYNGRFLIYVDGSTYEAYYREPNDVTNGEHWYYGTSENGSVYPTNFVLNPGEDLTIDVPLNRTLLKGGTQTIPAGKPFKRLDKDGNPMEGVCVLYFSRLDASNNLLHNTEMYIFDYADAETDITPYSTTQSGTKVQAGAIYHLVISEAKTTHYAIEVNPDSPKAYKKYETVLVPVRLSDWAE